MFKFVSGLLANWQTTLIASAATLAIGTFCGWYVEREIAAGDLAELNLRYTQGTISAIDKALARERASNALANSIAVREALLHAKAEARTRSILVEIPTYVTNRVSCITVGFVRVLDAAVYGIDPAELALDPGESNDTCTALEPAQVASTIAANYGVCRITAGQLNALADLTIRRDQAAPARAAAVTTQW